LPDYYQYLDHTNPLEVRRATRQIIIAYGLVAPFSEGIFIRLGRFEFARPARVLFSSQIDEGVLGRYSILGFYALLFEGRHFHIFAQVR
jgi:hypothetical protein